MKLIGARPSAFNGSDGRLVEGYNLYLVYDPEETYDGVVGEQCERLFVYNAAASLVSCSIIALLMRLIVLKILMVMLLLESRSLFSGFTIRRFMLCMILCRLLLALERSGKYD